jgi:diguanylate cyclase (GGDEF)-like protein
MKLRSLSARMVLVYTLMFVVVQAGVLVLVDTVSLKIARDRNTEELHIGARVLDRLLDQNRQSLLQAAEVLSRDFAFRQAIATGDSSTISSALNNHGGRISANVMMLASIEGYLVANSLHPGVARQPFPWPALMRTAQEQGKASSILAIDGALCHVVVVPVLAPDPIAWVAMGFSVNDAFLNDLRTLTSLHVSFLKAGLDGRWVILATTRKHGELDHSLGALPTMPANAPEPVRLGEYDTLVTNHFQESGDTLTIALQRSASEGLEPITQLKSLLALLTTASIAAFILGSVVLARRITQPLAALSRFSERIRDGDYSGRLQLRRSDEIGALSANFNHMLEGIAAREAEILRLAYVDTLTGLPNRAMFNRRLIDALRQFRESGTAASVLIMDLDRFKLINNTLGHDAGNKVLQVVAARLRETVREVDTVSRLGGDEFAILIAGADAKRALVVGRMIQAVLEEPIDLDGQPVDVGSSIGVAQCPVHGEDAGLLMRRADMAMYAAKHDKSGVAVYEAHFDSSRADQLHLLGDLRKAIADNQLELEYQPKLDLRSSQILGVEALVRWRHPVRGLIPPTEFILFAEQTGTIRHITRWVIGEAMRQCELWLAGGLSLGVSINVSARDLLDRELPQVFAAAARKHGIPADLVTMEVTESALIEDPNRAQETIRALKEIGLRVSIDDYGTGYSSLAYMQRLQCDELKVDRAFVTHAHKRGKDLAIVRSTVELGHSLGLTVVAEGVETAEAMTVLRELGCDVAQGYCLARPMPPNGLAEWLRTCGWATARSGGELAKRAERLRAV